MLQDILNKDVVLQEQGGKRNMAVKKKQTLVFDLSDSDIRFLKEEGEISYEYPTGITVILEYKPKDEYYCKDCNDALFCTAEVWKNHFEKHKPKKTKKKQVKKNGNR